MYSVDVPHLVGSGENVKIPSEQPFFSIVFASCSFSSSAVSTAAAGGQALLDGETFAAIKDHMWRLGAVTANGLDYNLLSKGTSSGRRAAGTKDEGVGGQRKTPAEWLNQFCFGKK